MRGEWVDDLSYGLLRADRAAWSARPRTVDRAYLWRLLVDRRHQGRGIGTTAIGQLCDLLRRQGCTRLVTSWVDGRGGPRGFYTRLGFVPTGRLVDGEVEAELDLTRS